MKDREGQRNGRFGELELLEENMYGTSRSFARRKCATQTAGPGSCFRKTRPNLLPSKGQTSWLGVMAPDKYYILRRVFKSAAILGGKDLAGASPGALASERPGQIRDDQKQHQSRQEYCKDDLLHYILMITNVISGRPFGFVRLALQPPQPDLSGLHKWISPPADPVSYTGMKHFCDSHHF